MAPPAPAQPTSAASKDPQVQLGAELYAKHCALCHGEDGKRGAAFQTPIWGEGAQIAKFSTAQGLFEYTQLMMPFDNPATLNDEQKWAVTAFMLSNHGIAAAARPLGQGNARTVVIR